MDEDDGGVDTPHVRSGPVLEAHEQGVDLVILHHVHVVQVDDGESGGGREDDGEGEQPDEDDGEECRDRTQAVVEGVDDPGESVNGKKNDSVIKK